MIIYSDCASKPELESTKLFQNNLKNARWSLDGVESDDESTTFHQRLNFRAIIFLRRITNKKKARQQSTSILEMQLKASLILYSLRTEKLL